jgi:tetratricopeptide (TPR) repeat protein
MGRLFLAAKLSDQAELCYLHAQALAADDMRWPYLLGHVYLVKGDRASAAAAFERALALHPADVPAMVWLAETRLDQGRPAESEALFLKAATSQPSAAAWFGAGRAALARGGYTEAVERFERALAIDGRADAIHYPLAAAYRALGDHTNADAHLRRRGETWPSLPDPLMAPQADVLATVNLHESRGVQALGAGDWQGAVAAFRQGLEITPDDEALRHRLATALYGAGDEQSGIRELEELLRRNPAYAKAHVSLGRIFNVKGRYKEAADHFSAAVTIDPLTPEAHSGLGEALRVSGQPAAALPHYQRAIDLDPAAVEPWIGGAMALIGTRRTPEAREWLARADRVHPDQPRLRELRKMLP